MKPLTINVSPGDFLDRYAILCIKAARITDPERLAYIEREQSSLTPLLNEMREEFSFGLFVDPWVDELIAVNTMLWECNDKRVAKFRAHIADEEYLQLTFQEMTLNDSRFRIKSKIDAACGSHLREQKGYNHLR